MSFAKMVEENQRKNRRNLIMETILFASVDQVFLPIHGQGSLENDFNYVISVHKKKIKIKT